MKDQLPRKLSQWEFKTNETKTEKYHQQTQLQQTLESLLGSLLDAQVDFKRRKGIGIRAAYTLKHQFSNKDITINVKTKLLGSYTSQMLLYNPERWRLTNNHQKQEVPLQWTPTI